MNRIIKFRAWDKEHKELLPMDLFQEEWLEKTQPYWDVMQFTGLLDKNGKEIFEGDIVNWSSWKQGFKHLDGSKLQLKPKVVVWHKGAWKLKGDETWNLAIYDNIEIIGNIYENPELLE